MMKNVYLLFILFATVACQTDEIDIIHYDCLYTVNHDSYFMTTRAPDCGWYSEVSDHQLSLDIAQEIGFNQEEQILLTSEVYAKEFNLSLNNATKLARNINSLKYLNDRTEEDIADFAVKMYGVSAFEIV